MIQFKKKGEVQNQFKSKFCRFPETGTYTQVRFLKFLVGWLAVGFGLLAGLGVAGLLGWLVGLFGPGGGRLEALCEHHLCAACLVFETSLKSPHPKITPA